MEEWDVVRRLGEYCGDDLRDTKTLTIRGWTTDPRAEAPAGGLFVTIDGRLDIPGLYGLRHPKGDHDLRQVGFRDDRFVGLARKVQPAHGGVERYGIDHFLRVAENVDDARMGGCRCRAPRSHQPLFVAAPCCRMCQGFGCRVRAVSSAA